ncbi:MAG: hypothetical protein IJS26_02865 [Alphaproteobacteria bacterium]|nr:hypothetical protein [Alphaproteobacteria bacterium]
MEYDKFSHDFISRCLENYKNLVTKTEFNVTLSITTLLTICCVIKSDNKANSERDNILSKLKENLDGLFEKYHSLKTNGETYKTISDIRNGFAHMIENNLKVMSNEEKQITAVKFKSNNMATEQEASVDDIHHFLLDLYEMIKKA